MLARDSRESARRRTLWMGVRFPTPRERSMRKVAGVTDVKLLHLCGVVRAGRYFYLSYAYNQLGLALLRSRKTDVCASRTKQIRLGPEFHADVEFCI